MKQDINRHVMKSQYQINMLWGQVCVLGFTSLLVIALTVSEYLTGSTKQKRRFIKSPLVLQDGTQVSREDKKTLNTLATLNPYARQHEGFLGFKDLRPSKTGSILPLPVPPITINQLSVEIPPSDVYPSFSIEEGNDTGFFIPRDVEIVDANLFSKKIKNDQQVVNHPCSVLTKVDPEYPYVAREKNKEGTVAVIVPIDPSGYIGTLSEDILQDFKARGYRIVTVEYQLVSGIKKKGDVVVALEEPADWFFAANLVKVLSNWTFAPWIENGVPVKSFMTIGYQFRLCKEEGGYQFIGAN